MSMYENLSEERKSLQKQGLVPGWMTTAGWQLFKEKYLYDTDQAFYGQAMRIAQTAAKHTGNADYWTPKFFELIWNGWLSCSTPVLSNMGTNRGLPVSCSGQVIGDSVDSFYASQHETAMLTKNGFGTAGYLGDIRPRGAKISVGGKASGVTPVFKMFVQTMRDIRQTSRRGAWAGYLPMAHGDFDELADFVKENPDDANLGWCIYDNDIQDMDLGLNDAERRFQKMMKLKCLTGKGYFFFPDKVNRQRPQMYKDRGLEVKTSQLCVAPETQILTRSGYQTISDLEDEFVDVWNGREWSTVQVVKTGENQELVKVVTGQGGILECTPYHKFYDVHGTEIRAADLTPGQLLATWTDEDGITFEDYVEDVLYEGRRDDTYCFNEPLRHMGVFNGLLTGQCSEIMLYSDADEHTYTCVLSSMNLAHYDAWKGTDAVQTATVFLDCVAQEFIDKAKHIPALHKAVRFTEKSRALGLGVCGFHTYLQSKMIAFESLGANYANQEIFRYIRGEADKATKWMAENWGEPEWLKGYGVRNSHLMAIAPTMSTALIMGGVSQGIEPVIGNCFIQASASGEQERINPVFLDLMKARGKYTRKLVKEIAERHGSVQHLDWLTDDEKMVFKTAFEINQEVVIRLASIRQRWIDQGQSLNLFFSADEKEEVIARVHQMAFEDENILSLYYLRTQAGVSASSGECIACQ